MTITFKGREVEVEEVKPGLVKKTDTVFYAQCKETKDWFYVSAKRLAKLVAKMGSEEAVGAGYTSRTAKATAAVIAKIDAAPAKKSKKAKAEVVEPPVTEIVAEVAPVVA